METEWRSYAVETERMNYVAENESESMSDGKRCALQIVSRIRRLTRHASAGVIHLHHHRSHDPLDFLPLYYCHTEKDVLCK